MENQQMTGLDEKIQRLINNYTNLKNKYAELIIEKADLEQSNRDLTEYKLENSEKLRQMDATNNMQKANLQELQEDNSRLQDQLYKYENKTKEALSKIDSILNQIDDID